MNEKEKRELKAKIITSAYAYKTRRKHLFCSLSIAASVIVILTIGFSQYDSPESSITEFAESSEDMRIESANDVQLFLSGNKKVAIQNNNSNIVYKTGGREVNITDSLGKGKEIVLDNPNEFNTLIVPYGKRSKIVLSDGTKVWLNSGSKLTYPATFKGKNREVFLIGEAIFDVSHDDEHPFKVLSKGHTIEVLGTVFNVSNYPDENSIRTVLKSGSVRISHKSGSFLDRKESIKINPGTMAVYTKDKPSIETKSVDVENYFSWREGVFIFKNSSLEHIMKKLNRYYNVTINFEEIEMEDETFSGYLDLKDSVESVLKILQQAADFNFILDENGLILINKIRNMD